ncbi:MAG: hypothetical protein GY935_00875 [Gammaproteobacteria bacterium]|nr:hypothetical protein [Gammaproteobacteria bacterium]
MLADTPYCHITTRCVRRACLCEADHYSGRNYEHRRQWVVDRIRLLSSLFAIDVCAYAVKHAIGTHAFIDNIRIICSSHPKE